METLPLPTVQALGDLPEAARMEACQWHQYLARLQRPVTSGLTEIARLMGASLPTARRKYDAWRKNGRDPLALVNRSKCPAQPRDAVTKDFIEWFRAQAERNQRVTRAAWRAFARAWKAGESIPGLDPALPRHTLPAGCSYTNLSRHVKDAFSLTVMRQGMSAAARHAPQLFSTRAGLYVGSHYMFDDLWHDNFVVFKGKLVRVVELDALDVFSGCKFAWGCKPRLPREDGTYDTLKESFMRMLLASVLFNEGYSPRGTVLMAEHGTAAISARIERLLHDRSQGAITTKRSGMIGKEQAVAGLFLGKGGGNPRFKSPIESLRNLIHNELAAQPGQTGKDVEHRPESTHGLLTHATDLIKAMTVLAQTQPEKAALIRLPLAEYHGQFLPLLHAVYDLINRRDWHTLEGWSECGHRIVEYRLAPDTEAWIKPEDFLQLPPVTQQMVGALARTDGRFHRERQLSPAEVWGKERAALHRIPAFVVAEILGEDFAKERVCRDCYFTFQDDEVAPEKLMYESRITRPDGGEEELKPDTYLTFVNPFDPQALFVHDSKGRHLGIARRVARIPRNDPEALKRQFGRNNKRLSEMLQPIRKRHAEMTREAAERDEHNAALLSGRPITPMEKDRARALRNLQETTEGFLNHETHETHEPVAEDFSAEALL